MNNVRILDKSTYPKKTLETFEMIAAYYVDLFYNHLYFEAKNLRNNKVVSSVTEGYKHTLTSFLQGIEDPKLYKKSLLAMHTFFIENGFSSITFTQCTERVIMEFIPEDYYESVVNSKKNAILRIVLTRVNKNFILKLITNFLGMIIDQHNEPDNTRILQDEFIDLLLIEKESMYKRFVVGKAGISSNLSKKQEILESFQKEIKLLCAEKYELRKHTNMLKKIIIAKEEKLQQSLAKINQLNDTINELKSELNLKFNIPASNAEEQRKITSNFNDYSSPPKQHEIPEVINKEEIIINSDDESEVIEKNETNYINSNNLENDESVDKELINNLNAQLDDNKSMFVTFDENTDLWE